MRDRAGRRGGRRAGQGGVALRGRIAAHQQPGGPIVLIRDKLDVHKAAGLRKLTEARAAGGVDRWALRSADPAASAAGREPVLIGLTKRGRNQPFPPPLHCRTAGRVNGAAVQEARGIRVSAQ